MTEYLKFDKLFSQDRNSVIDYSKLKATRDTVFSSELPSHMAQIIKIIHTYCKKTRKLKILDATSHVGGFSLVWAKLSPKDDITSVEIRTAVYEALRYNAKILKLTNVTPVNQDINDFIRTSGVYDFVYLDPPWGGPDYHYKRGLMLYLGATTVVEIIRSMFAGNITKWIFLKAPTNFDFSKLTFAYSAHTVLSPGKQYPDFLIVCIPRPTA